MIIQKIVFPESPDMDKRLYYRVKGGSAEAETSEVVLKRQGILDLVTYFNSFSAGKWKNIQN